MKLLKVCEILIVWSIILVIATLFYWTVPNQPNLFETLLFVGSYILLFVLGWNTSGEIWERE